jgi:hypothetical protein
MIICYKMNPAKSYSHYASICIFLLVITFAAGCTGVVKTPPASPSVETTPLVVVTPSSNVTMNSCPLPVLIFNNSQEITNPGGGMRIIGHNNLTGSEAGTVPLGGVIYHGAGFTRIFDSTGKQILSVNDSESVAPIPAGVVVPVTYIIGFTSGEMYPQFEGENVTRIYQEGYDTCIATIIQGPGAFKNPPIPPH